MRQVSGRREKSSVIVCEGGTAQTAAGKGGDCLPTGPVPGMQSPGVPAWLMGIEEARPLLSLPGKARSSGPPATLGPRFKIT